MHDTSTFTDPGLAHPMRERPALIAAWGVQPGVIGLRWLVDEQFQLHGREGSCPLPGVSDDGRLSREHLRLRMRGSQLEVEDLDSKNGTFVQGRRVRRARLSDGDLLRAGEALFVFRPRSQTPRLGDDGMLVGNSGVMGRTVRALEEAAPLGSPVMLVGATGTGKELAARLLHRRSSRSGAFVAVNCGGLAEGTFRSELFGHVKGAFTGAAQHSAGLFHEAEGGTLLLDEIGDASPALQVALLRVLQEKEIRPVGATRPQPIDVRIVVATHRALDTDPLPHGFRRDLAERLRRWVIRMPPLSERVEDIPQLVVRLAQRHGSGPHALSSLKAEELCLQTWSGNVRQLDALAERWAVSGHLQSQAPPVAIEAVEPRPRPARPSRDGLQALLRANDGNVSATARSIGISRRSLYRWCQQLRVDPTDLRR